MERPGKNLREAPSLDGTLGRHPDELRGVAAAMRDGTDVAEEVARPAQPVPRDPQTLDFMTWNVSGSRLAHVIQDLPARPKFIGSH